MDGDFVRRQLRLGAEEVQLVKDFKQREQQRKCRDPGHLGAQPVQNHVFEVIHQYDQTELSPQNSQDGSYCLETGLAGSK